jgi:hypothetical protein
MTIQNNPLKQYFRRPSIYLKLPSGGTMYAPGVVNIPESGELAVYPMTAIDEITAKTPDALFNGTAMSDIIKSCIPDIKDPWSINSVDLDAILIAIRSAADGNDMSITSGCPSCKEISEYAVNLVGILNQLRAADYDKELTINDLSIKFRPLTYKEINEAGTSQMEAQRIFIGLEKEENEQVRMEKTQQALKYITEITMNILSKTFTHIKTPSAFVEEIANPALVDETANPALVEDTAKPALVAVVALPENVVAVIVFPRALTPDKTYTGVLPIELLLLEPVK